MESKIDFKSMAKKHLAKAKEELSLNDEERLKYAALEIRMAMEAVTYERAQLYKDEISPELYETWQPKKLMSYLLEVDPYADQTSTLSYGIEEEYGVPAKEMKTLGTEHILSLRDIRKNYDAIGHYLHIPTYSQLKEKGHDFISLRERCVGLTDKLEAIINSRVFNTKFTQIIESRCKRCESPIKKNVIHLKKLEKIKAQCLECKANYSLEYTDDEHVAWIPEKSVFNCVSRTCNAENSIWNDQLIPGTIIPCNSCSAQNQIALSVILKN